MDWPEIRIKRPDEDVVRSYTILEDIMLRIALYIRQKDKHYYDDAIWAFQRLMRDPHPEHIHIELDFGADMFSSSGRRKDGGVRFTPTQDLDLHKWDFYPLLITPEQEKAVRAECHYYTGLSYDYLGIIGMALPFNIQMGTKWYCSEICNHVLFRTGIADRNVKIRPSQMLESYKEQGLI